jgi:hypothetical protein
MNEPTNNAYVLTIRLDRVRKADARKLAEAVRTLADHEGIPHEIAVAHLKFEG